MVPLPLPGSSSFSIARCLKASCSDTALSVDGASVVTGGGFTVYVWATHGLNWADNAAVAVRLASAGATLSIAAGSSPGFIREHCAFHGLPHLRTTGAPGGEMTMRQFPHETKTVGGLGSRTQETPGAGDGNARALPRRAAVVIMTMAAAAAVGNTSLRAADRNALVRNTECERLGGSTVGCLNGSEQG